MRAVLLVCCAFWHFVFRFPFAGDGGVDIGEGGREVCRGDLKGGAGVADGDVDDFDASPRSCKSAQYDDMWKR